MNEAERLDAFLSDANAAKPQPNQPAPGDEVSRLNAFLQDSPAAPQSQSGIGDTTMAAVSGLNAGVEDITYGALQLAGQLTDKVFGTQYGQSVTDARQERLQAQNEAIAKSPKVGAVARVVGNVGASLPASMINPAVGTAGGIIRAGSSGIAQGAVMGALMYDQDNSLTQKGINSLIGAATGGAVGATLQGISNVVRGIAAGKNSAQQFVKDIADGVQKTISPNNMNIKAKDIIQQVDDKFGEVTAQKNALYAVRDKIADSLNVKVNTVTTNNMVDTLAKSINIRPSAEDKALLSTILPYKGQEALTVKDTYNLLKRVGQSAETAVKTDPNKARILRDVQSALDTDLHNAIQASGNKDLSIAHDVAQGYYAKTYLPIKTVARGKAIEKLTEDAFVSKLVADASKQKYVGAAMDVLGPNAKQDIMAAHMNAVKEAVTDPLSGNLDFRAYASTLNKDLIKNPAFASIAKNIGSLSDVLNVVSDVTMNRGLGIAGGALTGFATVTGNPVMAAMASSGFTLGKVQAWNALGVMLNNPETLTILQAASSAFKNKTAAPIQATLLSKASSAISAAFNNPETRRLAAMAAVGETVNPKPII